MTHEQEHIIIRHYKDRVSYYGLPEMPAWVFGAAPIVAFIAGALIF